VSLKEELEKPFSMEAELAEKSARLAYLDSALNLDSSSGEPKTEGIAPDISAMEPNQHTNDELLIAGMAARQMYPRETLAGGTVRKQVLKQLKRK
jgi:hypothetical protein